MWGPIRRVRGCSEPTGTLGECPAKVSADSTQLCLPWASLSRAGEVSPGLHHEAFHPHVKRKACRPAPRKHRSRDTRSFLLRQFSHLSPQVTADVAIACQGTPCTPCCCSAFRFFCCGLQGKMIRVLAEDNYLKELHHQTSQVVSVSPTGMDIPPWMWVAPRIIPSSRCYEAWRHGNPQSPHLEPWAFSGCNRAQEGPKGLWTDEAFSARHIHLTGSVWCWCYSHIPHVACCGCDGGLMFKFFFIRVVASSIFFISCFHL